MFVNKSAHRSECKPRRVLPKQNCLCLPFPHPLSREGSCLFVHLVSLLVWDEGNREDLRDLEFCFLQGNKCEAR